MGHGSYPRLGFRVSKEQNVMVLLSHLVYWRMTGDADWEGEISHLCGNHLCCNQDHLVCEDHFANLARTCCRWASLNPGKVAPSAYPYRCPHWPPCVLEFNREWIDSEELDDMTPYQ